MPNRPALFAGLLAALFGAATAAGAADNCPDLSGHYRVDGFGPVLGDVLEALDAHSAGFTGSEVRLRSSTDTSLAIWLKSGSTGRLPTQPNKVLTRGADFSCENGWLLLKKEARANRRTDAGWHEGNSRIRIAPAHGGGLTLVTTFSGSQRSTLYSYDSARISLPKPFTSISLTESIRWPDISEPAPASAQTDQPAAPEAQELARVRQLLGSQILGNVRLGGLKASGSAVRVTLAAPRSEDVARLEDRLRAAAIAYEMKVPPVWSNNVWHLELLVSPERTGKNNPAKPSAFRVQQEMGRMSHPMVDVTRVDHVDDAYVATLNVLGGDSIDSIITRLKMNTTMFSEITSLGESVRPDAPKVRVVRLKLRLR